MHFQTSELCAFLGFFVVNKKADISAKAPRLPGGRDQPRSATEALERKRMAEKTNSN